MVQILQFKIVIEQDEDGRFVASVPSVPGCFSEGKTYEKTIESIKEALELSLEVAKENKEYRNKITFPVNQKKGNFVGIVDLPIKFAC